jgi:hypothetical protein
MAGGWEIERRSAMSAESVVLRGLVRADGSLEVPGKVGLTPGPVEVTVRAVTATAPPAGDWWEMLQKIRAEHAARGQASRSAEEIDAEINAMRDEWEEHQLAIERMQEEFRQAPEGPLPPAGRAE